MSRFVEHTLAVTTVHCEECPFWYGFANDQIHAWEVARAHELAVHTGENQAANALLSATKRRQKAQRS